MLSLNGKGLWGELRIFAFFFFFFFFFDFESFYDRRTYTLSKMSPMSTSWMTAGRRLAAA